MLKLLQLIFLGHSHQWKILTEAKLNEVNRATGFTSVGRRYTLQCVKCGDIKKKDMI